MFTTYISQPNWDCFEPFRTKNIFFENGTHFQNLAFGGSQTKEFSWTSRFQNLHQHISKPIWDGFKPDMTTGARAIFILVEMFLEHPPTFFGTISLAVVLYNVTLREYMNLRLYEPCRDGAFLIRKDKRGWRKGSCTLSDSFYR